MGPRLSCKNCVQTANVAVIITTTEFTPASISESATVETNRFASWVVLAVPLIVVLVGAWSYRWVQEDAFINFRIVANLLAGHGPVYNVGERVEAYSDPLWLFVVAGLHGALPFISIEWLSVLLGLGGTATGVVLGGRAIQRLGSTRGDALVVPIGLLIFSVVAGVWEFSTSGLEMGMVFCWIGLSFWLLVRTENRRTSALWCAFIVGLGTLIRPELILMSAVFLAALGLVVAAPGWKGPPSVWRRFVMPLLAAAALPVLYQLWRMAYFALIVPNTALAKSAGSSWWSQGFYYLWNFVVPYALWVPMILVIPLTIPRIRRWWTTGDRIGVAVLLTPACAGIADAVYVVHIGGDYMHARLLLPAFLSLCIALYLEMSQLRSYFVVAVAGIVIWLIVCAGMLRFDAGIGYLGLPGSYHNIEDERATWIAVAGTSHPITTTDYRDLASAGNGYRTIAAEANHLGLQVMVYVAHELSSVPRRDIRAATSTLPFRLVVNLTNIGVIAFASGSQVYVFDNLSLANPIGSHTIVERRGRPGHEKAIGPVWMIARFGLPGEQFQASEVSTRSIAAARKALGCQPLSSYLHAITSPLTLSQAFSNMTRSLTYTTMSFSSDPIKAERQLCQ